MRFSKQIMVGLMMSAVLVVAPNNGFAEEKVKSERVRFETYDGVELHGTFYPSNKGRKASPVLMLHKLGGNSHANGWDDLAADLQKQGYAVLSFDFRGHGKSTTVDKKFWRFTENVKGVRASRAPGGKVPETISYKNFRTNYYPYLINDILSAKLFLETKNDGGACNASNTILIGAEEGATLGMLWMFSETKRYKMAAPGMPEAKPQSRDVVAAVWLSMSTSLGRLNMKGILPAWLRETGREHQVPMVFFYGEDDKPNNSMAEKLVRVIRPKYTRKGKVPDNLTATLDKGIPDTKLAGSKLLIDELGTRKLIVDKYLEGPIAETYAIRTWEERKTQQFPYLWYRDRNIPRINYIGKGPGEKAISLVPLKLTGLTPLGQR